MKSQHCSLRIIVLIGMCALLFPACQQKPQERVYTEKFIPVPGTVVEKPIDLQAQLQEMLARGEDPHASLRGEMGSAKMPALPEMPSAPMPGSANENAPLTWKLPHGWTEKPASGMRVVSFSSQQDKTIDVSIVVLGGPAGGITANINRWLNQISLPPLTEAEVEEFLARQEKLMSADGTPITLVDLTSFIGTKTPLSSGILAGIIETSGQTIFIKMAGTLQDIDKNREAFKTLCQSSTLKK